jgi:flagella basal body P-ring formation protein FlgA
MGTGINLSGRAMKSALNSLGKTLFFLLVLSNGAVAQESVSRQDHAVLRQTIEQFLGVQTVGLPGKASISVGPIDSRLNLPACPVPEAFMPNGSRAWGKTTVGVRCTVPAPWTIYVAASVRVHGDYFAAALPLAQGQTIEEKDIAKIAGDLTALPPGVITDPSQAVGRTLTRSIPFGAPLRQDALRSEQAVKQGQMVRVVSAGPGFRVSTEGRAMSSASEGQLAQVRTPSGQLVSGIARSGGIVEVRF